MDQKKPKSSQETSGSVSGLIDSMATELENPVFFTRLGSL